MDIRKFLLKFPVLFFKKSALLSALACRLVKWTGKYPDAIHPKHIVQFRPIWYLSYIKSYDRVLDIGCNNGQHTVRIARQAKAVVGIDYDLNVLELAKKEIKRKGLSNITLKPVNIETGLPFRRNEYTKVIFLDVLEHLRNRNQTLKEVHRVLKPGGFLFLSVPKSDTSWKKFQKRVGIPSFSDPDHKVEFTKKSISNLIRKSGFNIIKISPVTFDTPLVGFIDMIGGISLFLYKKISKWRRELAFLHPEESIGLEIVCQKS